MPIPTCTRHYRMIACSLGFLRGPPSAPGHNPNPTFGATWADLVFVEVDLDKIVELPDRNELIFSAEYVTAEELRRRIAIQ